MILSLEKYVGQWKEDEKNGKGINYGADGKIKEKGRWEDDMFMDD